MYVIRVRAGGEVLEATFSGHVPTDEALRAVSQGFALAEAGRITAAIADVRQIEDGPTSLLVIAATFSLRLSSEQRVAVLCDPHQVAPMRRFARFAGIGSGLGVFTREEDAEAWLTAPAGQRLSQTALRHLGAFEDVARAGVPEKVRAARSG